MSTYLTGLNPEQKIAVTHNTGPCLIIAGAGTGKTKVLTTRIAYLIQENMAKPEEILALTFTEKAATEMEERIDQILPLSYGQIWIKTFHSFCDQILREKGIDIGLDPSYKILPKSELLLFFKKNLFKFSLNYFRPLGNPNKFILILINYFSKLKDENILPHEYRMWVQNKRHQFEDNKPNLEDEEIEILELEIKKQTELTQIYKEYQESMIKNNQLDYGDLIIYTLKLFRERPNILHYYQHLFKYILVDEYQDTNFAQNEIVRKLSQKHQNIMVVGDDDQAIYSFRGASVTNILQFQDTFKNVKKVVLTKNYRSTQHILDIAYHSIQSNNPYRLEAQYKDVQKQLTAETLFKTDNHPIVTIIQNTNQNQEVESVLTQIKKLIKIYQFKDIAIIGRAKNHLKPFYEALIKIGYPVQFNIEQNFKDHKIIKDLLAILRVIAYPSDQTSWFRVLKMPQWGLSMEDILMNIKKSDDYFKPVWKIIKKSNTQTDTASFDLIKTMEKLLNLSRNHDVTEVLYQGVLQKLDIFKILEKDLTDESLANIQAISRLLQHTQKFVSTQKETHVKAYIDYLNLTEESGIEGTKEQDTTKDNNSITVSTIHGVKGLEYKAVFMINLMNDRFPSRMKKDPLEIPESLKKDPLGTSKEIHIQEERRLFYVAVTRAKEKLFLNWNEYPSITGKRRSKRSIFLDEISKSDVPIHNINQSAQTKIISKNNKSTDLKKPTTSNQPINIKKPIFSYSQLSTYEFCPKKYQYSFQYRIPTPPSAALSFGSTLHNTLHQFYKIINNKQTSIFPDTSNQISLEKLLDIYENAFISNGYKSLGHMVARKKHGQEILIAYYNKFKDYFGNPLYLEKSFTLRIGEIVLKGRFDRVDTLDDDNTIVEIFDYKTGRTKTQKEVDKDLQLSIYAMAAEQNLGKKVEKLSLYFLDENLKVTTSRDIKSLDKAKEKIQDIAQEIISENFIGTPSKFKCAMCDYRNICNEAIL